MAELAAPLAVLWWEAQVETFVDAPPQTVYALVSDVTRIGPWRPEIYRCDWIRGATGPTVGARFKARNRRRPGPTNWSSS